MPEQQVFKVIDKEKEKREAIREKYKMKEGNYRVKVTILEANDLMPLDNDIIDKITFQAKGGSLDPLVVVQCHDQSKSTKPQKKTLNPIFNQNFFFDIFGCKKQQLEEMKLTFRVYDHKKIIQDAIIGQYEIDLSSVYFMYQHEIYMGWLNLYDPTGTREGVQGFIKVNIQVIGPGESFVVHDLADMKNAETEKNFFSDKIAAEGHLVNVDIYRGEHLAFIKNNLVLDDKHFIKIKYSGMNTFTDAITSYHPEWNTNCLVQCTLPNQSKFINVEVWNYQLLEPDQLVGIFKIKFKEIKEKEKKVRWGNIYGPPLSAKNSKATDLMTLYGYRIGSHYRGRVLYGATTQFSNEPKSKAQPIEFYYPLNPIPQIEQTAYTLRVDLYSGYDLPQRQFGLIHISIGPYLIKSPKKEMDPKNPGVLNLLLNLPDKRVVLPKDIEDVPDVIIYFCDDDNESSRHSYCRITAKEILISDEKQLQTKVRMIKFQEDFSQDLIKDSESAGFIYANIQLFQINPPEQRVDIQNESIKQEEYQLRVYLFMAKNIDAADQEGTSDPFFKISCGTRSISSSIKYQTLNPGYFETLKMNVFLPPPDIPFGMSITCLDHDEKDCDMIGKLYIQFDMKQISTFQVNLDKRRRHLEKKQSQYSQYKLQELKNRNRIQINSQEGSSQMKEEMNDKEKESIVEKIQSELNDVKNAFSEKILSKILKEDQNNVEKQQEESELAKFDRKYQQNLIKEKLFKEKYLDQKQVEVDVVYQKPRWYNIVYDATQKVCGKVLLGYTLIKKEDQFLIKNEKINPAYFKKNITENNKLVTQGQMHLFVIGMRDIQNKLDSISANQLKIVFNVGGFDKRLNLKEIKDKQDKDNMDCFKGTEFKKIQGNACNYNYYLILDLEIPKNNALTPIMDIIVLSNSLINQKNIYGTGTFSFAKYQNKLNNKLEGVIALLNDDSSPEEEFEKQDSEKNQGNQNQNDENNYDDLTIENIKLPNEVPKKVKIVLNQDYEKELQLAAKQQKKLQAIKEENEDEDQLADEENSSQRSNEENQNQEDEEEEEEEEEHQSELDSQNIRYGLKDIKKNNNQASHQSYEESQQLIRSQIRNEGEVDEVLSVHSNNIILDMDENVAARNQSRNNQSLKSNSINIKNNNKNDNQRISSYDKLNNNNKLNNELKSIKDDKYNLIDNQSNQNSQKINLEHSSYKNSFEYPQQKQIKVNTKKDTLKEAKINQSKEINIINLDKINDNKSIKSNHSSNKSVPDEIISLTLKSKNKFQKKQEQFEEHPAIKIINQQKSQNQSLIIQNKFSKSKMSSNGSKGSKKSLESKLNDSIKSKKVSIKSIVTQNSKKLGFTQKGIEAIDEDYLKDFSYQHKGMGQQQSQNSLKQNIEQPVFRIEEDNEQRLDENLEDINNDKDVLLNKSNKSEINKSINDHNKVRIKQKIKTIKIQDNQSVMDVTACSSIGIGAKSVQDNNSLAAEKIDYQQLEEEEKMKMNKNNLKKGIMKSMGVSFSNLKNFLFQKKKDVYNYEDFDTDEDEDLQIIPEWLRDRLVEKDELENCMKMNKNIIRIPIKRGSRRDANLGQTNVERKGRLQNISQD